MITRHSICALDEDHPWWRHYAIHVNRISDGKWVLDGFDYAPMPEGEALQLANELAPQVEVNGRTVAQAAAMKETAR